MDYTIIKVTIVAANIANINRVRKKKQKYFTSPSIKALVPVVPHVRLESDRAPSRVSEQHDYIILGPLHTTHELVHEVSQEGLKGA